LVLVAQPRHLTGQMAATVAVLCSPPLRLLEAAVEVAQTTRPRRLVVLVAVGGEIIQAQAALETRRLQARPKVAMAAMDSITGL
jgi:hypothetical protein